PGYRPACAGPGTRGSVCRVALGRRRPPAIGGGRLGHGRERPHQRQHRTPGLPVVDREEGLLEDCHLIAAAAGTGGDPARALALGKSLEEVVHRHPEEFRDEIETAGADTVGSLLVFLDLAEGQPEMPAEATLADAEELPSEPHPASDMRVDLACMQFHVRSPINLCTGDAELPCPVRDTWLPVQPHSRLDL